MAEADTSTPFPLAAVCAAPAEKTSVTEAEFRTLYAETARPLKSYLSRMTGDPSTADDLLQEAYYHLLRAQLPPMEPAGRRNYLYRIATNLARDHFRRKKYAGEALPELRAEPHRSEAVLVSVDVQKILNEVKPGERQLLWLAYVDGASHREIAAVTGLKEASVRPLLFRARRKLGAILRERGFHAVPRTSGGMP
jgi:RNA polymerase sigma-70 factor (ECF subfamily)